MTNAGAHIHQPRSDAMDMSGTRPIDPAAGIPPTSSAATADGTPAAPFDPAGTRSLSTARWALALALFLVLSFGLAWLVAAPLWVDGGLANPLAP